jgi:hypothetical protein
MMNLYLGKIMIQMINNLRVCLDGGTRKDEEGWDEIILI